MPKRGDPAKLERELDRLYGLPLGEFTAARNALSRQLKEAGDARAAERVKELEKPSRSAAAINRAVRQSRRDVKGLVTAAGKLNKAQQGLLQGVGRRAVDQAVEAERAAVERLMAAVESELGHDGGASETMLGRARDTLHAVATDPGLRKELEAGRISADHTSVGLGGLTLGGGRPAKKAARSAGKSDARRRLKRAERELEDAERALQRAESAQVEAKESLEAAVAAVARSEKKAAEAAAARDEARAALKRA